MFLSIQIDWIMVNTYDRQFTLTTKKSLHIIFKGIRVSSEISILPSETLFKTLNLASFSAFCHDSWHVDRHRCCQLHLTDDCRCCVTLNCPHLLTTWWAWCTESSGSSVTAKTCSYWKCC